MNYCDLTTPLSAYKPKGTHTTFLYKDGTSVLSRLTTTALELGEQHRRTLLRLIRSSLSDSAGDPVLREHVGELVRSGLLYALHHVELNPHVASAYRHDLQKFYSCNLATTIARSVLLDKEGHLRLGILHALDRLAFKVIVTRSGQANRTVVIATAKGPLYVCSLDEVTSFSH